MIEKIAFSNTGHFSTRTLFGAAALGGVTQDEADATLETLLEYGVNHIDTAASYGAAEERIGPWMARHRGDFFLATKTGERTYQKARDQIHRSLERLQVDVIDLIQLHNLVDESEWETALGNGGHRCGRPAVPVVATPGRPPLGHGCTHPRRFGALRVVRVEPAAPRRVFPRTHLDRPGPRPARGQDDPARVSRLPVRLRW